MKYIDRFLNAITMYRIVLYGLSVLAVVAIVASFFAVLPFSPLALFVSLAIYGLACYGFNFILASLLKVPFNIESSAITALLLFFIFIPPQSWSGVAVALLISAIAIGSKYILTIRGKHLFNPAALAAVAIGLVGFAGAYWWVASPVLVVPTLIIGFLVVRKIRRFTMIALFLAVSLVTMMVVTFVSGGDIGQALASAFLSWPLLFFAGFMLTEPLTMPPSKTSQLVYAVLVALLFSFPFRIGRIGLTPELALVLGNIFSFIVSSRQKLLLRLKEKRELAPNLYEFVFSATERLRFKPGQYLEWTLPQVFFESRGNRRYFTIASSPTEDDLRLGVRFVDDGSQFKRNLLALRSSDILQASNLSGNFIMPEDTKQKLVFIAGGIGITPFRSMLKYLIDRNEKRDVVLIYACLAARDFAYRDILKAAEVVGVRTLFLVTDPTLTIASLPCETGYLTVELLQRMIPDFKDRLYYLSGPDAMVRSYERMLHDCSISRALIKKDYFPGF